MPQYRKKGDPCPDCHGPLEHHPYEYFAAGWLICLQCGKDWKRAIRLDLTGQKIHRLTFIRFMHTCENRKSHWLCRCECGNTKVLRADHIKSGRIQSCGCLRWESIRAHLAYLVSIDARWRNRRKRPPEKFSFQLLEQYFGR